MCIYIIYLLFLTFQDISYVDWNTFRKQSCSYLQLFYYFHYCRLSTWLLDVYYICLGDPILWVASMFIFCALIVFYTEYFEQCDVICIYSSSNVSFVYVCKSVIFLCDHIRTNTILILFLGVIKKIVSIILVSIFINICRFLILISYFKLSLFL